MSSAEGGGGPDTPPPSPTGDDPTTGRATPEESAAPPVADQDSEPGVASVQPGAGVPTDPDRPPQGTAGAPKAAQPQPDQATAEVATAPEVPPDSPAAEAATPDTPEPQGTAPEASAPEDEPAPVDDTRRALLDALAAELGDDVVGTETRADDVWVRVRRQGWRRTAEVARSLGFDYFCFLSGLDWMPSTAPSHKGEVAGVDESETEDQGTAVEPAAADQAPADGDGDGAPRWQTGYAGGDSRFQVFARLYSTRHHVGVTFKADLDDDSPAVETWSPIYSGADWHERETWEMFGFDFVGHPHLTHIYLPGEFEGFPLRKDFPLLAREVKPWPGLVDVEPMPDEDEEEAAATSGAEEGGEGS